MSGELKPELFVAVGMEITVFDPDSRWTASSLHTEVVTKVARVWITTDKGRRFRLDRQNEGQDFGWGGYHFRTAEQYAYEWRIKEAWAVLAEHGLAKASYGKAQRLHDAKLFAVAELLEHMDAADALTRMDQELESGS
jgi:hypothetical protein